MAEAADDPIYMYTMVRMDLASLNSGKAMAQSSHATSHLMFRAIRQPLLMDFVRSWEEAGNEDAIRSAEHAIRDAKEAGAPFDEVISKSMIEEATHRGFGVEVTLGAKKWHTVLTAIGIANEMGVCNGIVRDPTYPISDGEVTHFIPLETCGYLFGRRSECINVIEATRRSIADPDELKWHP